jgi:hypothetical protein
MRTLNIEKQLTRTMKDLNKPLRNALATIRNTREDTLYKLSLQNFFKGSAQTFGLKDEVGLLGKIGYAEAIILHRLKDMPLACHLRRFRINSIK